MNDRDIDAEFDAIVARWDEATDAPPESPSPAAPTTPVAPPVAPPKPRTVQDITSAYAALSRREPDAPAPVGEPTASDGPAGGDAASGEVLSPEARSGEGEEPGAWRAGPSVDDEDDHFEPPAVQLPPGEDIGYWGAVLGLVGGPLLLLWVVVSEPFYGGWWTLGAILVFFGGFGLLVLRQPRDRDPFDDDNGARV